VTPRHTRAGTASVIAPKRSQRGLIVASAVALVAAVTAFLVGRRSAPEPAIRVSQFEVVDSTIGGPCCGPEIALSPDGRLLVSMRRDNGTPVLAARALDGLEFRTLPGTEGGTSPFFSPDGRWMGFASEGRLRKIALAGGPPITITEIGTAIRSGSWGTNDTIVYANDDDDRIYVVAASGGAPRRVTDGPDGVLHRNPTFLPGNRRVIYTLDARSLEGMRLAVLDLESGVVDTLETPGTMARFAPPNSLVFTGADGSLLIQPFDPAAARPTAPAVALLDGVRITGNDGSAHFAVSTVGDLVYQPGTGMSGTESLVLADERTRDAMTLPRAVNMEDVAMAPDGRRVVMRLAESGGPEDLWLFDRDQGTLTRFTTEGNAAMPSWTPDGARIAYSASRDGDSLPAAIFWRASDGSGEAELLLETKWPVAPLGFLSGGRELLVQAFRREDLGADIGIVTVGDTTPRWLVTTQFAELNGQASPDGRWLAYASNRSGQFEVYVEALSGRGGRTQISTGGGMAPRWSPDAVGCTTRRPPRRVRNV